MAHDETLEEMAARLAPCPFCGGKAEFQTATEHDNASVRCCADCCDYWAGTNELVLSGWNRRDQSALHQARQDGLRDGIERAAKWHEEYARQSDRRGKPEFGALHDICAAGIRAMADEEASGK